MKMILILGLALGMVSAQASVKELCGKLVAVDNFELLYEGKLSVIELKSDEDKTVLLYDKRDLVETLNEIANTEGFWHADLENVRFSYDDSAGYYAYSNYQMKSDYYACATVDTYGRSIKFPSNLRFKLYEVLSSGRKRLMFSRESF